MVLLYSALFVPRYRFHPPLIQDICPDYCHLQPGQCGSSPNSTVDPGHHAWYVKTYCTHNALGRFTLYFPYILLLSALVLAAIERIFKKLFKSNVQVEGFHSLLVTAKKIEVLFI